MGMTIDKAIEGLHAIQEYYNDDTGDIYLGFGKADNESVDFAIDTMRKYQKIEQIAERYEATKGATPKGPGAMMKDIIEIVKGEKE